MSENLTKGRARAKRLYNQRKGLGQCVHCGGVPMDDGLRCASCREKKLAFDRRWIAKQREVWKKLGLCLMCGMASAIHGQVRCGRCAELTDEANARRRRRSIPKAA